MAGSSQSNLSRTVFVAVDFGKPHLSFATAFALHLNLTFTRYDLLRSRMGGRYTCTSNSLHDHFTVTDCESPTSSSPSFSGLMPFRTSSTESRARRCQRKLSMGRMAFDGVFKSRRTRNAIAGSSSVSILSQFRLSPSWCETTLMTRSFRRLMGLILKRCLPTT
jgi:hypothetical protein